MVYIKHSVLYELFRVYILLRRVLPIITAANLLHPWNLLLGWCWQLLMLRRVKILFSVFNLSVNLDSTCIKSSYYVNVSLSSFPLSKTSAKNVRCKNTQKQLLHWFGTLFCPDRCLIRTLHNPVLSSVIVSCKIDVPAEEFLCFACIDVVVIFANEIVKGNCAELLQT